MSMVEKEKDLIGFANKVISFRMNVIKACRAKGIDVPTDEQISDYINDYGLHFNDFMADYTEHEGMFRCMTSYDPLEQKTLNATLKLSDEKLRNLWNVFIEESAIYGSDSHVFSLHDTKEIEYFTEHATNDDISALYRFVSSNISEDGKLFFQWLNDGGIKVVKNIKNTITAYWGEIFERIMMFPNCYDFDVELYVEGDGSTYFSDVFFPIIAEEVGYKIDGNKGTITKIKK